MNDSNDPIITEEDRAAIVAGLEQLWRNSARPLKIRYGEAAGSKTRIRQQLYLTSLEHQSWKAVEVACAMAVGRPVSAALLMRVGLHHLLKVCAKSLTDPVVREKLKADILQAREDRVKERVKP